MKFLAEMGISPRIVLWLREAGHDATHLHEEGHDRLSDEDILEKARREQRVVLTHDLDFGDLMAASRSNQPGVIIKAALRGEPSYVWGAGQDRRLKMILEVAGERVRGRALENGCGVGMYVEKLSAHCGEVIGLEYDFERAVAAHENSPHIVSAACEYLPFLEGTFDLILSHEVIEHVEDDRAAIAEMVRALRPGGRLVLFCPNRGYPFETHGIYWRGKYQYGNIPLVNWLPRKWRDQLAPHVKVYSRRDVMRLFEGLPIRFVTRAIVFGAYDNIIARFGALGRVLRGMLQFLEGTPLKVFGLSHFWGIEKDSN